MEKISLHEIKTSPKIVSSKSIQIDLPITPKKFFQHGWQSWSLSTWITPTPLPVQKPDIFHPLQSDIEHLYKPTPHSSWVGAVELDDGGIILLGALGLNTHVHLGNNQLSGNSEADEVEWLAVYGNENQVFELYASELGKRFGIINKNKMPRVWCSWYSLYSTIDEKLLFDIFDKLEDLPFDVLQVDDGWQVDIGDWDVNEKFPSGMEALANKIKSSGRQAGLWLAPLIATKRSKLFREHKDWFLHDHKGKLVSAGFNWNSRLYALDTTHPEVITWLTRLMKQVRSWGFDYLKLDFLYAGALKGKRYNDIPRETAYRESLKLMRDAMGDDAFFLSCGTPIFPTLGVCDAIRIGPDVAHIWERFRDAVMLYNFTTPGTKNAIRTSLHRLWLKPIIHIDPDVEYFVAKENFLEPEHKQQLQDLAMICGFKATSDLPHWMTTEEREQIRTFLETNPTIIQTNKYEYQLDNRKVDFTSAVSLPKPPRGFLSLWAKFLGWLGSIVPVLWILKLIDDIQLNGMRSRIK